jgi:hypothetical protein
MVDQLDRDAALQRLYLTFDAPPLLNSGSVVRPVEDFGRLYRMSTGIYGHGGYRRIDRPFPFAHPHVSGLRYGSPLSLEVIVPTIVLLGTAATVGGLPLLNLIEQVLLASSRIAAKRQENLRDRDRARLERIELDEQLANPREVRRQVRATRRADIAEAETRELRATVERADLLEHIDPDLLDTVDRAYGDAAVRTVGDIARRAANGPARPADLEIQPVEDPESYPEPPGDLPRPGRPDELPRPR